MNVIRIRNAVRNRAGTAAEGSLVVASNKRGTLVIPLGKEEILDLVEPDEVLIIRNEKAKEPNTPDGGVQQ